MGGNNRSKSLTITFNNPGVFFEQGKSDIKQNFKNILDDFMPRFLILLHKFFKNDIAQVRIEGHTSSDWVDKQGKEAFIENMKLSQERTQVKLYT